MKPDKFSQLRAALTSAGTRPGETDALGFLGVTAWPRRNKAGCWASPATCWGPRSPAPRRTPRDGTATF